MTAAAPAPRCSVLLVALAMAACDGPDEPVAIVADTGRPLAALAEFPVGVAVPAGDRPNSLLESPDRQALVQRHFDSITAENIMKMAYLHPAPGATRLTMPMCWSRGLANGASRCTVMRSSGTSRRPNG